MAGTPGCTVCLSRSMAPSAPVSAGSTPGTVIGKLDPSHFGKGPHIESMGFMKARVTSPTKDELHLSAVSTTALFPHTQLRTTGDVPHSAGTSTQYRAPHLALPQVNCTRPSGQGLCTESIQSNAKGKSHLTSERKISSHRFDHFTVSTHSQLRMAEDVSHSAGISMQHRTPLSLVHWTHNTAARAYTHRVNPV